MKKLSLMILVLGMAFALAPSAHAQKCPDCGLLKGSYYFNVRGQAVIGTPTLGTCKVSPTTAAAFTSGRIIFDGHGNIGMGNYPGVLSVGATSCTFFGINRGTYSVEDKGDGTFEAKGVMYFDSENPYAPCNNTSLALNGQPFVITGTIGGKEIDITTNGADPAATYAEGNPGTGLSCQAPIENFLTSGTGELSSR